MSLFNYNIEPVLEGALVALLQAQQLTAGSSFTSDNLATPRVDVRFELGAERDGQVSAGAGLLITNTYEGQFVLSVITDRDSNGTSHSTYRATVRQIMAETTATQWEAALGANHKVLAISHLSTAYQPLDAKAALDASVMIYNAVVRLVG